MNRINEHRTLHTGPLEKLPFFITGRIECYPSRTVLILEEAEISIEHVAFMAQRANKYDGVHSYPRPFVFDESGNILSEGDYIAVLSVSNDQKFKYLVLGTIQSYTKNEITHTLDINNYDIHSFVNDNDYRKLFYSDDSQGNVTYSLMGKEEGTGNISIEITGTEENGNFDISTSGNTTIEAEKIFLCDNGNEEQPIVLGRTLVEKLSTVLTQLTTPGNIITPAGPGQFAPNVLSELHRVKNTLEDILSERNFTR